MGALLDRGREALIDHLDTRLRRVADDFEPTCDYQDPARGAWCRRYADWLIEDEGAGTFKHACTEHVGKVIGSAPMVKVYAWVGRARHVQPAEGVIYG